MRDTNTNNCYVKYAYINFLLPHVMSVHRTRRTHRNE